MLPTSTIPKALSPEYTCDVDEPITLYQGEGILSVNGKEHRDQCLIRYSWHPNQGVEVVLPISVHGFDEKYVLDVPAIGLKAPVLHRQSTRGTQKASFTGLVSGKARMGQETSLERITFHIANFPFVLGNMVERGTRQMRARIHLESAPWVVDLDPVPDEHASDEPGLISRISEARGHAITHVGSLTRTDGRMFDIPEADEILRDVSRTLSLARAAYSRPFLLSGYDAAGTRVWRCWSGFHTDAWTGHENWFSEAHPQSLQSVFVGWRRLAKSPDLEVISAAAGLYNDSHSPGLTIESKLVLAQAALEGLAEGWPHPPLPGAPSLPKFGSGAANRIAQISISLGLPLTVPTALQALEALAQPSANAPALDKVTWVRNSIAHLGNFPRLASHSWMVKYEARQLATWHLELALLRILDANGLYLNRLTAQMWGDAEQFPWYP